MNIIEVVKSIVAEYPGMDEFTGGIHVDFTRDNDGDFGLYSTGDTLIREDILGNQRRQHNFILYAHNQSVTDYERLNNSAWILNLHYWLWQCKYSAASSSNPNNQYIKYTSRIYTRPY